MTLDRPDKRSSADPRGKSRFPPGGGRGQGGGFGFGPGGNCVCPKCGKRTPHQRGQPCYEINCPECGTAMVRNQKA
ncbi:MAG: hypothetical protein GF370_04485 [Candidatus Nealsonbacteria bacterium]|nr:hypothetical protein [Candidatus Nealsonbacteria bacterium]